MSDAQVVLDRAATVAPVKRRLFGSFVEHLGRCVYDGIGPRAKRPKRLDLAWHSLETNEVGVDEFAR